MITHADEGPEFEPDDPLAVILRPTADPLGRRSDTAQGACAHSGRLGGLNDFDLSGRIRAACGVVASFPRNQCKHDWSAVGRLERRIKARYPSSEEATGQSRLWAEPERRRANPVPPSPIAAC